MLNEPLPLRSVTRVDGRRRQVQDYRRTHAQLLTEFDTGDVPATVLAVIDTLAQAHALMRAEFRALVDDPERDSARFCGIGNLVLGSSRTLGLKRTPQDVPSLREYLNARASHTASADAPRRKSRKTRGAANGD